MLQFVSSDNLPKNTSRHARLAKLTRSNQLEMLHENIHRSGLVAQAKYRPSKVHPIAVQWDMRDNLFHRQAIEWKRLLCLFQREQIIISITGSIVRLLVERFRVDLFIAPLHLTCEPPIQFAFACARLAWSWSAIDDEVAHVIAEN